MKIAILSPCPVPDEQGATERLWWGLARHLNEETAHQAEFLKIPYAPQSARSLVHAYQAFFELDLGGFDAVISGERAAWMASHPRHVAYLMEAPNAPPEPDSAAVLREVESHADVASLVAYMRRYRGASSALAEFFLRWNEIAAPGNVPERVLEPSSPLVRQALHWMDEIALGTGRIARLVAPSAAMAARVESLAGTGALAVARAPVDAALAPGERFEHFFAPGPIDGGRMALLLEAMRHVRSDRELLVEGIESAQWQGDARIRMLGHESLARRREHYRDALAVVILAGGEEGGLLAAEAAACARGVITTSEAGPVLERAGPGARTCEPRVEALGAEMQRIADAPQAARALGRAALESAGGSWSSLAEALLASPASPVRRRRAARKLLLASTFAIHPPRHGGQSRIYHLYRALAPEFETAIVSIASEHEPAFEGEIAPGVREIRVPLSQEHQKRVLELAQRVGTSVIDVTMPQLHTLTPALSAALRREAEGACAAVASHPYFYPALAPLGLPVWYEAHNVEVDLKSALFKDRRGGEDLIAAVRDVEGAAVRGAELILCASPDDARALVATFGARADRMLDVPNGTDASRISFQARGEGHRLRAHLGLEGTARLALFIGSGHWPNIEATKEVFRIAAALPEVAFVVVGSVCYAFDARRKPANALFLNEVDDVTRNLCFHACDVALNPMEHGSGTNLKMLDFFAAGLPAITTERGARGLELDGESQCLVRPIDGFARAVEDVLGEGSTRAQERARRARELVEREFDWDAIARRIKPRLMAATAAGG